MISYVLLIIIAISLSAGVYSYLRIYVPSYRPVCPSDIYLGLEQITCNLSENPSEISIVLSNKGLFNVSGAFIRAGPSGRRIKTQINENKEIFSSPLSPGSSSPALIFTGPSGLAIGASNELEIQPALIINGQLVPCRNAIVTYPLTCSSSPAPQESSEVVCGDGVCEIGECSCIDDCGLFPLPGTCQV